jgi:antitoxin component of RelBE/YafQ-DinJ toxin-antitoxin module
MPVPVLNVENDSFAGISLLGVDDSKDPSLSTFPPTFSRDAFNVWVAVLESPEYLNVKEQTTSTTKRWYEAVRLYLRRCEREGEFPFRLSTQQSRNDMVMAYLKRARLTLVKYFEDAGFFEKVKIRRLQRTYLLNDDNLTIVVEAILQPFQDPTFNQWLRKMPLPRMLPSPGHPRVFERHLVNMPGIVVYCDTTREMVTKLGYRLTCPTKPVYPSSHKIPTNEQMSQFIESLLWIPIVRIKRIKGAGIRLF